MSGHDRERWDARYQERVFGPYPPPDALLVAYTPHPVGKAAGTPYRVALALAAGQCQNALWLAEQGYLVNAMDISRVALERGRAEMAMRNLRDINFIPIDLESIELPEDAYDLIACFRYLDRNLFPAIRAAMKPGGLIVYQTFNVHQLERFPDCNQDYLLEPRELPSHFPGWQILHDEERGEYSFLVARKPQSLGGMP
jgi:SAM-dependent methyltransferase